MSLNKLILTIIFLSIYTISLSETITFFPIREFDGKVSKESKKINSMIKSFLMENNKYKYLPLDNYVNNIETSNLEDILTMKLNKVDKLIYGKISLFSKGNNSEYITLEINIKKLKTGKLYDNFEIEASGKDFNAALTTLSRKFKLRFQGLTKENYYINLGLITRKMEFEKFNSKDQLVDFKVENTNQKGLNILFGKEHLNAGYYMNINYYEMGLKSWEGETGGYFRIINKDKLDLNIGVSVNTGVIMGEIGTLNYETSLGDDFYSKGTDVIVGNIYIGTSPFIELNYKFNREINFFVKGAYNYSKFISDFKLGIKNNDKYRQLRLEEFDPEININTVRIGAGIKLNIF